jgi:hypothetical protein
MSETSRDFGELRRLLDRLMLGTLDAAGHAKLDELVVADIAARRQYIERMFLIGELGYRLGNVAATANLPWQAAVQPALPSLPKVRLVIPPFIQRRPVTWSILAAGLLFAAYVTLISWGMLDSGLDRDVVATGGAHVENQKSEIRNQQSEAAPVATIRDSVDAQWSRSTNKLEIRNQKSEISQGEPLAIDSGLVELQLKQGVTLLIEGPADWTIDGQNNATLKRGKLVAKVPQQAIGFTVTTPTAKIVDLGTEFGVEVVPTGTTDVQVFAGVVEVQCQPTDSQPSQVTRLTQGQALRLDRGSEGTPISPDDGKFAFRRTAVEAFAEGIVIEDSGPQPVGSVADTHFAPADDDLLQTALDPRRPVNPPVDFKGQFEGQLVEALLNGRLYPLDEQFDLRSTFGSFSSPDGRPIEFYFDLTKSPTGYDIDKVETYTGWDGTRLGQRYLLVFRWKGSKQFDATRALQVDLANVKSDFAERKVTVRRRDGQPLASGVEAIGFVILDRNAERGTDVYREIDVFGKPSGKVAGPKQSGSVFP